MSSPYSSPEPFGDSLPPVAKTPPRAILTSVTMVLTALLMFLMAILPAPYLISMPGPAMDVLGAAEDSTGDEQHNMIEIVGAETFPSKGKLLLTTVSGMGSPGYRAGVINVLRGWWLAEEAVQPIEYFYPRDTTPDQADETGLNQMLDSQDRATIAALEFAGYDIPTHIEVAALEDDSVNQGVLQEGDVLLSINGQELSYLDDLTDLMEHAAPGDTLAGVVKRGTQTLNLEIPTVGVDGATRMQIYVWERATFPIEVNFNLNNVGGPSAGLMFALGIIDLLSPDAGPNGQIIAGTGTIDENGMVGPIGGIRQKLHGADRAGATWFLSPADNCEETIGHEPEGMTVLRVTTLQEAHDAVSGIGQGKTDHLPRCR